MLTVSRGTVVETVSATGQVRSKSFASLRFKTPGVIAQMPVNVGDLVSSNQLLAALDTSELSKKVIQAEADLAVADVALENSRQDLRDASTKNEQTLAVLYDGAPSIFSEILNSSQQAQASFATFYAADGRLLSQIANAILDSQLVIDANNAKSAADLAIRALLKEIENLTASANAQQIQATIEIISDPLAKIQQAISTLVNAVSSVQTGTISASTLDAYKDILSSARTNINSAVSKANTLASNLRDAKVKNSLAIHAAEATERAAAANLEKQKASVAVAKQNQSDAYLRAPFAGTISVKSKQVGEQVTSADQVLYILGEGGLEISANIPEVDIAKIKIGDSAKVKFDAYGKERVFEAVVAEMDPAETIVDGIATYRIKLKLVTADPGIRSGMTAELSVITAQHDDVLKVSQRAIKVSGGESNVRILSGQTVTEQNIKTGLRGSDGSIEVTEGLTDGTAVIVGEK